MNWAAQVFSVVPIPKIKRWILSCLSRIGYSVSHMSDLMAERELAHAEHVELLGARETISDLTAKLQHLNRPISIESLHLSANANVDRFINFYHDNFDAYPHHRMAGFGAVPNNPISQHLSALEDALIRTYGGYAEQPSEAAISALQNLCEMRHEERAAYVLLGYWKLRLGRLESAAQAARHALQIDSRCIHAQWILLQTYRNTEGDSQSGNNQVEVSGHETAGFRRNLADRFCEKPFTELTTVASGDVFTCCPSILPIPIGNVFAQEGLQAWNSPASQEVRRSILDGDFRYCSRSSCHLIQQNLLPLKQDVEDPSLRRIIDRRSVVMERGPALISFGHDATCNLSCPQCRSELIVAKGPVNARLKIATENLKSFIDGADHLVVTNSGDPFASRHYRNVLREIGTGNYSRIQEITLLTNGLLFTEKEWQAFSNLHTLKVNVVVSIDACNANTYREVRRRGDYNRLLSNLYFLSGLRQADKLATLSIRFAVQAQNFEEMPDFVRLGQDLKVDAVVFTKLENCGTYSGGEYERRAVCAVDHPQYPDLLRILQDPVFEWGRLNWDNLLPVYEEAVSEPSIISQRDHRSALLLLNGQGGL